jgi:O-antigen/teichoic acid export membrane protein
MLPRLSRILGKATFWSFLSTGMRMGGLVLILPIILRRVPSEELGLWYVFQALGFLGVILDLGFGSTLVRAMAFLWAGAPRLRVSGFEATGPGTPNAVEIHKFVATLSRFYALMALVFLVVAQAAGGWWVHGQTAGLVHQGEMQRAWAFYALGLAVSFHGNFWPALLQGINGMVEAQKITFVSLALNYLLVAGGVLAGWGIWALVVGNLAQGFVLRLAGRHWFHRLTQGDFRRPAAASDWSMLRVLWPMAWRGGGVAVGAYLILNANTLLCGRFLGLEAAASFGVSMQLILALTGICGIWFNIKVPLASQMHVRGENEDLKFIFYQRMQWAVLTYLAGACALLLLGPLLLEWIGSKSGLLPLPMLGTLTALFFLEMHASQHSTLVLSKNINPFLGPALGSGLAICLLGFLWVVPLGLWGLILAYGVVQMSCNFWLAVSLNLRDWGLSFSQYLLELGKPRFFQLPRPSHD